MPFPHRHSSRQAGRDDTLVSTFNLYKLSANKQKVSGIPGRQDFEDGYSIKTHRQPVRDVAANSIFSFSELYA